MVQFTEVQKALEKNRKKLLEKNLRAVGIGYKIVEGKPTGELSIICSVGKKLPLSEIKKKDLVPAQVDLNPWYKKYQGVKTDVIEVGEIKALHTEKHRPAIGGISIGHVDITAGVKSAILGMKIKKSGRTTGITTGEITQVDVTVNVQYGEGKIATFEDQIMAGPISKGGDSGSAVLTEDNYLCGLLFAGSDEVTICNRIENVFELLNIRL